MRPRFRTMLLALLALVAIATAACGDDSDTSTTANTSSGGATAAAAGATTTEKPTTIRLGYFPNVTHASAIVGVEKGLFAQALGDNKLETSLFNAGPAAVEALFAGAIDATYIGPNPAINAYAKDKDSVRIVSGATSAGALFVVKPDINSAADLKGKKVASPQLGNTQDVALRYWLKQQGLKTTPEGGGDVSILPQENAQTLETFKSGDIVGAWVPEPWATRLIQEGGGKVLVDEKSLWPGGEFVTTHLIVNKDFLAKHPDAVRRLIEGQIAANKYIADNPADAKTVVNDGITKYTGKGLKPEVLDAAWKNLSFTDDPIASSLVTSKQHAEEIGLLKSTNIDGIYDLTLLNEALKTAGLPEVND